MKPEPEKLVHPHEDRGAVAAAAAQSGGHRDTLGDGDIDPRRHAGQLEQEVGGTPGDVRRAVGNPGPAAGHPDAGDIGNRDVDGIAQIDPLHDHAEVVIAVRPLAQDIETVIDLGGGLKPQGFHGNMSPVSWNAKVSFLNQVAG